MIRLRFEKGSLSTSVVLKDSALPGLMALVAEHQSDDESPPPVKTTDGFSILNPITDPGAAGDRAPFVREWMGKHSESEILQQIGWDTFPERILLLGAHYEASGGGEGWSKSDIDYKFSAARVQEPTNFARDISNAIKSGWIAAVTPRTYRVSRTGWNRLAESVSAVGG